MGRAEYIYIATVLGNMILVHIDSEKCVMQGLISLWYSSVICIQNFRVLATMWFAKEYEFLYRIWHLQGAKKNVYVSAHIAMGL